jgi:hypothetical protein
VTLADNLIVRWTATVRIRLPSRSHVVGKHCRTSRIGCCDALELVRGPFVEAFPMWGLNGGLPDQLGRRWHGHLVRIGVIGFPAMGGSGRCSHCGLVAGASASRFDRSPPDVVCSRARRRNWWRTSILPHVLSLRRILISSSWTASTALKRRRTTSPCCLAASLEHPRCRSWPPLTATSSRYGESLSPGP